MKLSTPQFDVLRALAAGVQPKAGKSTVKSLWYHGLIADVGANEGVRGRTYRFGEKGWKLTLAGRNALKHGARDVVEAEREGGAMSDISGLMAAVEKTLPEIRSCADTRLVGYVAIDNAIDELLAAVEAAARALTEPLTAEIERLRDDYAGLLQRTARRTEWQGLRLGGLREGVEEAMQTMNLADMRFVLNNALRVDNERVGKDAAGE